MRNRSIQWFIQWVIALSVPLLLVIGSVRVVMTPLFLQLEYTRDDFQPDFYGFTTEDRLAYGPYGVEYILNGEDISYLGELTLPGEKCWPAQSSPCSMFNDFELQHMVDVKNVAQAAFAVALVDLVLIVIICVLFWRDYQKNILLGIQSGSLITIGAIIAIVVAALVAWDEFFNLFHALFFTEGTWQFLYSDTLIRLYPEQFWFEAALVIGGITSLGAVILFLFSRYKLHQRLDSA
ncbi:TIGR01906 family membrane protein [Phototrophicus methaneseepsis]|uniref:TIGR01906 family membrane protein n=1 Tax=Phototrophicus methaneseepsis TaxID=2710758 RepID=A0A7S8ID37_9CHLR|nr:TIGR01906 family membrane protein [Phototrophicus methaneseepsis]QPC81162.1 TIGR01906 family membrane protein [Phototrophicus methaneseepsis]